MTDGCWWQTASFPELIEAGHEARFKRRTAEREARRKKDDPEPNPPEPFDADKWDF